MPIETKWRCSRKWPQRYLLPFENICRLLPYTELNRWYHQESNGKSQCRIYWQSNRETINMFTQDNTHGSQKACSQNLYVEVHMIQIFEHNYLITLS